VGRTELAIVKVIIARHGFEEESRVVHRPGHGSDVIDPSIAREDTGVRDEAKRRLETDDTA
jgi:hypothetical protein